MASADRPNKVDQPTEPTDHPPSTPERIDRSDQAAISYRADNWSKADPIKLLTPEQRDKAYPPTNNPDPTATRDRAEPESIRRVRDTENEDAKQSQDERSERSKVERPRNELWRNSEDVLDAVDKAATAVDKSLVNPPTGRAETRTPVVTATEHRHDALDTGDVATSIAAAGMLVGEGIRLGVRHWSQRRQRR